MGEAKEVLQEGNKEVAERGKEDARTACGISSYKGMLAEERMH